MHVARIRALLIMVALILSLTVPTLAAAATRADQSMSASVQDVLLDDSTSPNRYVGILYETWFVGNSPNIGTPNPTDPVYPAPSAGKNFRYWGRPAGGAYWSSDDAVIQRHLTQIASAGVDFLVVDLTGGGNLDNPGWDAATHAVVGAVETRVAEGKPTPLVTFMANGVRFQRVKDEFYSGQYSPTTFFNYGSLPLILAGFDEVCPTGFASVWTCRATTGLDSSLATKWSYLNLTPQPYSSLAGGWAEEMAVAPAQQATYMTAPGARGRRWSYATGSNNGTEGQNLRDQWAQVAAQSPAFVVIDSWNQWASQGQEYTDELDPEFSTDIEPEDPNDANSHGGYYLSALTGQIAKYKRDAANLISWDSSNGAWSLHYGRGGARFAVNNFTRTFNWSAYGPTMQPVVGDFNNDSITDIALRNTSTGTWHFAYGNGTGNYSNTVNFTWAGAAGAQYQPFVGYFDSEHPDWLSLGLRDSSSGVWHLAKALNSSGSNFTYKSGFSWAAGTNFSPFVGDFNDDGKWDIGLRDAANGVWHFAVANSVGTFSNNYDFTWAASSAYSPIVGDWNCDGLSDIGLFHASSGRTFLAIEAGAWARGYNNQTNVISAAGASKRMLADPSTCAN